MRPTTMMLTKGPSMMCLGLPNVPDVRRARSVLSGRRSTVLLIEINSSAADRPLAGGLGSTSAPLAFAGGLRVQALSQALVMLVAFFLDSRFTSFVALPRAVFDPVRRA